MSFDLSSIYDSTLCEKIQFCEKDIPDYRAFLNSGKKFNINFGEWNIKGSGGMKLEIDGFNLLLQDFCSYCPDFEPEVEQIDCTAFGEGTRCFNNIRCVNESKCSKIAENLEIKIENSRKRD